MSCASRFSADFTAASALGWPVSFAPIQGGNKCFQVPGCENNMTVEQNSRLGILDAANVYSEIQFAEWGYWFSGLRPAKGGGNLAWWHAVFPNTTCNASLCAKAPGERANQCCAACLRANSCGKPTNSTEFDVQYALYATPAKDPAGHALYGYRAVPASKQEAYEIYRSYYNSRIARVWAPTCKQVCGCAVCGVWCAVGEGSCSLSSASFF